MRQQCFPLPSPSPQGEAHRAPRRMNAPTKDPLVLFMPSGRRGRFPVGTPVLDAARSLGVYIEIVCGGRGICGRCQIEVQEGEFAKHGITSSNDHLSAFSDTEARYVAKRGELARAAPPLLLRHDPGRPRRRRAAGRADQPPDRQEARRDAPDRARSDHAALLCRGRRAGHGEAARRHRPAAPRACARLALRRVSRIDFDLLPRVQKILRDGEWKVTAAVHLSPGRAGGDRALAGPEEFRLRHRRRHRLHHHRLPPLLAAFRPHARLRRHSQPADPLRRRSDEPRLLRDDEPGRARGDDQGRARGDRRADRQGLRRGGNRRRRDPRLRLRRQSDHASPLPRHRSDRAWRRALRARRLRRAQFPRPRYRRFR